MDNFLEGKTAVVTGGSRGIGRAIAQALLGSGASVAICGLAEAGLNRAASEMEAGAPGRLAAKRCDVSKPDQVKELFEFVDQRLGGLDILINNAGIGVFASVADTTIEQWDRTLGTNLSGTFYCCREALPRFRKRGGGFIINVSSLAGKNPFSGGSAYNASKFGMNGFSEAMMLDHRYDNVRVSYIMPGSVATDFNNRSGGEDWKIASEDIADIVMLLLRMPERTLISRVEVRPSKPKKG